MSGGSFDYKQYHISEIADTIEHELEKQGKLKPKEDLYMMKEYYEDHPEEKYYETYPDEVQKQMREGIKRLRMAAIYAQRIDWYLAGDDGDENFLERLKEDLDALKVKE